MLSVFSRCSVLLTTLVLTITIKLHDGAPEKHGNATDQSTTCNTATCVAAAKQIREAMDPSIDPCDDFYQYACGGYLATHEILANETEASTFRDVTETTKYLREDVLASNKTPKFESEQKAKEMYRQCADQATLDKLKGRPLLDFLHSVIGGWPLVQAKWNASTVDLISTLTSVRSHLYQPLLSVLVDKSLWNPLVSMLSIGQPETSLNKDVLLGKDGQLNIDSYTILIQNVTALLRNDAGVKDGIFSVIETDTMISDIVELEQNIAMAKLNSVQLRNVSRVENMTLHDLQTKLLPRSSFGRHLPKYINSTFSIDDLWKNIHPDTIVMVDSADYLTKLDDILLTLEKEKDVGKRKLASFIGWRIVMDALQYLSKDYRDTQSAHTQRIRGQIALPQTPTAERCTNQALSVLPMAIGAMYVRDVVPPTLRAKAMTMTADIRDGFRSLLTNARWMDNQTRTFAFAKLDQMFENTAYPDILVGNMSVIDEHYKKFDIQATYYATVLAAMKFQNADNMQWLARKNVRNDPIRNYIDVTDVNAFYDATQNGLTSLVGILRDFFFNADFPSYLNYGGIGFVIGHETTHGFDDQGSLFDDQGLLRSWWTNRTRALYQSRANGLRYQYGNYSLSVGSVNGYLTLGENIADNGGLKAAYNGYELFRKRQNLPDPQLPGFGNFSTTQMFFLSAAQVWCGSFREKIERFYLLTDNHSPPRFRVIGPMSNMPEFSAAYHCSSSSRMNITSKQGVW